MSPRLNPTDYYITALKMLGVGSHQDLTIASLCDALGMSKGSFYHHFGGWPGFLTGLLEFWERESTLNATEIAGRLDDPEQRRRVIAHLIDTIPHQAEGAIRVWARSDALVATVQGRVDEERIAMLAGLFAMRLTASAARQLAEMHHAVLVSVQMGNGSVSPQRMREPIRTFTDLVSARYGSAAVGRPKSPEAVEERSRGVR